MGFKDKRKKWKKYSAMSNLGIIVRRKFFNNCFDGALTCAGIVSGLFIVFLNSSGVKNTPNTVIIYGFATALAIGISGLWGAFLSEEAERKKKMADLRKEMVIMEEIDNQKSKKEDLLEDQELEAIQKAMISPIKREISLKKKTPSTRKRKKRDKTIIEHAEDFATWIASLVDGLAPVLGSSLPLIPFFFGTTLTLFHFIFSYIILAGLLIFLGIFLGNISGGGKIKYSIHLITAGVVTLMVSILLGI